MILPILLYFLSFSALFGGFVLIISPNGSLLGIPLTILKYAPFSSFLIPGIILFLLLGVLPAFVAYALAKDIPLKLAEILNLFPNMRWSWTFTIYISFILFGWIFVQVWFIRDVHWLHVAYFLHSCAILTAAFIPAIKRKHFKHQKYLSWK